MIGLMNSVFAKHHRILFGGIVTVVIVTFVGYFSTGSIFDIRFNGEQESGYQIFGKSISAKTFQEQAQGLLILRSFSFGAENAAAFGRNLLYSQDALEQAMKMAPDYIARQMVATTRGIGVSDIEVDRELIRMFSVKGKYSAEIFQNYSEAVLRPAGISELTLRNAVRNELVIVKLEQELQLVPAVAELSQNLNDNFSAYREVMYEASIIELSAAAYLNTVEASEAEMKSYYENNQAKYEIPAEYVASVAVIDYNDPAVVAESVRRASKEELLDEYFINNTEKYTPPGKETPALSQVRKQVVDDLAKLLAPNVASDLCDAFAAGLYEKLDTLTDAEFIHAAGAVKVNVLKSKPFAANAVQITFDNGQVISDPALVDELAAARPVSNVYAGADKVYFAYVTQTKAVGIKDFREVETEIRATIVEGKATEQAMVAAQALRQEIMLKPIAERNAVIAAAANVKISKLKPFGFANKQAYFPSAEYDPAPQFVAVAIGGLETGGLSVPVPVANGVVMLRLDRQYERHDAPQETKTEGNFSRFIELAEATGFTLFIQNNILVANQIAD